jgi:hypothetical protein
MKSSYTKAVQKIKKTGTYKGKSNRLGGGGRFAQMVAMGIPAGKVAMIGRAKYGKKRMAKWSAQGRKRTKKNRRK